MTLPPRDRRVLVATVLLAAGAPVAAAMVVESRTTALAEHLGVAGGVPVRIGAVDADLTGAIRVSDVALGGLLSAEAIEASVALGSVLSGTLRADEIRVARPRVSISVGADGDSDLARLARRLAHRGPGARGGSGRVRRIVVSSGTLTANIAGLGQLSAEGVELLPDATGVRVITGALHVHGASGPLGVEIAFARSSAELSLATMTFGRALAVGGAGTVTAGPQVTELHEITAGRLVRGGDLEIRAAIDAGGIDRPLAVALSPRDLTLTLTGDRIPLRGLAAMAPRGLGLDEAVATGSLAVRRHAGTLTLAADGTFEGVVITHKAVAADPVRIAAHVATGMSVTPAAITVTSLAIDTGALHARLSGWLRRGAPTSGQLEVSLEPAPCNDLLAAIPVEVRGALDGLVLDGTLGGSARLAIDLAAPLGDGTTLTTSLDGGCRTLAEPPGADVTTLATAVPHQFADGSRALVGPGEPTWVELRSIPWRLQGAFVSAEDGRFWDHAGFDLQQIARSLEIDLRERRLARGGSTISQQLVKNAFLTHRRTLDRKLQEAVLTWRLEERLDKKAILERYLNIVELGPRVFGIGAAARHWFEVSPRGLSIRQGAFLAAMTSEPTSMSRRVRRHGGLDPDSAERVATILRAMRRDGVIDQEEFDAARVAGMHFAASALRAEP